MNSIYVIMFIMSIVLASFSQVLLKKGASKENIYLNKATIIGYGIMIFSTLLTLVAYRKINLSLGQILQSLSFVFVIILSYIFLKEKVSKRQILGVLVIIVGIIIFNI